ncbi:hypothetical protein TNCV_2930791 [Trichonephila clavipes]|nr:hypothetical protein TNCV_2930791 [Trichonephila clavipes]
MLCSKRSTIRRKDHYWESSTLQFYVEKCRENRKIVYSKECVHLAASIFRTFDFFFQQNRKRRPPLHGTTLVPVRGRVLQKDLKQQRMSTKAVSNVLHRIQIRRLNWKFQSHQIVIVRVRSKTHLLQGMVGPPPPKGYGMRSIQHVAEGCSWTGVGILKKIQMAFLEKAEKLDLILLAEDLGLRRNVLKGKKEEKIARPHAIEQQRATRKFELEKLRLESELHQLRLETEGQMLGGRIMQKILRRNLQMTQSVSRGPGKGNFSGSFDGYSC